MLVSARMRATYLRGAGRPAQPRLSSRAQLPWHTSSSLGAFGRQLQRVAPSNGGSLAEAALSSLEDGDLAEWRLLQECRRLVVFAHLKEGHLPIQQENTRVIMRSMLAPRLRRTECSAERARDGLVIKLKPQAAAASSHWTPQA
eukprot:scaffold7147_cov130-Isochrysis_galbana.AAC.8